MWKVLSGAPPPSTGSLQKTRLKYTMPRTPSTDKKSATKPRWWWSKDSMVLVTPMIYVVWITTASVMNKLNDMMLHLIHTEHVFIVSELWWWEVSDIRYYGDEGNGDLLEVALLWSVLLHLDQRVNERRKSKWWSFLCSGREWEYVEKQSTFLYQSLSWELNQIRYQSLS